VSVVDASVIVALNPHEGDVHTILDAYAVQAGMQGRFELIIVDNGTRPGAAARCAEHALTVPELRARCVESPTPGRAAANNAGVRASKADLLIFVADDFLPGPTLVRAHVEFHRSLVRPAVGIGPAYFTAGCRADPFRRWLEESGRLFGVPFRTAAPNWSRDFFYVGNASLARGQYERVGGFDEAFEFDLFDDFEFGMRLRAHGVRTHLLPKALAWHDHAVTMPERMKAMRRSGEAACLYEQRQPGVQPWAALADLPLAALALRVEETRRPGAENVQRRGDHFCALMDLAFAQGYHGLASAPPEGFADG
jgi:cellulose synthase/poly-beta-1,6-N-acetylglucosamine synthase-like glycosyltransferase